MEEEGLTVSADPFIDIGLEQNDHEKKIPRENHFSRFLLQSKLGANLCSLIQFLAQ